MSKKSKRHRNPTYKAGLVRGVEITLNALNEAMEDLEQEKGIGEVTRQKIQRALDSAQEKIKL